MLQYSAALFPQMSPDIPRNRLMFQQVLVPHFNVARCIVSIIVNTSFVSETLLTKRAILSDALQAYMYSTCSYYSRLLLWHIAAPGAVFSCNFNHKSIVRDLQYLLVIQVQLASDIKLRPLLPTREERAQALRAAECTNKRYSSSLTSAMRVFTQLQSTHVFSPRCMQVGSLSCTYQLYAPLPPSRE